MSNIIRQNGNLDMIHPKFVFFFILLWVVTGCLQGHEQRLQPVESFMLGWKSDPARTMVIDWHPDPALPSLPWLRFRSESEDTWVRVEGERINVPESNRFFYRVELTGLQPDSMYEFFFPQDEKAGIDTKSYWFRTMPDKLDRPIKFVAAGDMLHRVDWMRNTAMSVMKTGGEDLDFAVIGGDLAYADGEGRKVSRWYDYFQIWSEVMVTSENRVIPHIAAIGNHEVKRQFIKNYNVNESDHPDFMIREAPYFSTFVPMPGENAYGLLDFGEYLTLYLLDSGHARHIDGEQSDWLETNLHQRTHVRHHIPVYHVAAFPSAREFDYPEAKKIRNHWVPLFEKYGVRLAFEHHDHTYKRTHPVKNGLVDASGVFYVGDGAWGVRTRPVKTDSLGYVPWYIANADSVRHYIMATIDQDDIFLEMYDEHGTRFDGLHIVHRSVFDR